jgi:hypothetical protein
MKKLCNFLHICYKRLFWSEVIYSELLGFGLCPSSGILSTSFLVPSSVPFRFYLKQYMQVCNGVCSITKICRPRIWQAYSIHYTVCCITTNGLISCLFVLCNCIELLQLESHGQEVIESLYIVYCSFLSGSTIDFSSHYRHFVIDHSVTVTIRESSKLISQGTTGLCSWQVLWTISQR